MVAREPDIGAFAGGSELKWGCRGCWEGVRRGIAWWPGLAKSQMGLVGRADMGFSWVG